MGIEKNRLRIILSGGSCIIPSQRASASLSCQFLGVHGCCCVYDTPGISGTAGYWMVIGIGFILQIFQPDSAFQNDDNSFRLSFASQRPTEKWLRRRTSIKLKVSPWKNFPFDLTLTPLEQADRLEGSFELVTFSTAISIGWRRDSRSTNKH